MPTYVWECKDTGNHVEITCLMNEMETPPVEDGDWFRLIQAPKILKRLIPSGFGIREADSSWQAGKEIAALEDSTLDMPRDSVERQDIRKEVKKIKSGLKNANN